MCGEMMKTTATVTTSSVILTWLHMKTDTLKLYKRTNYDEWETNSEGGIIVTLRKIAAISSPSCCTEILIDCDSYISSFCSLRFCSVCSVGVFFSFW